MFYAKYSPKSQLFTEQICVYECTADDLRNGNKISWENSSVQDYIKSVIVSFREAVNSFDVDSEVAATDEVKRSGLLRESAAFKLGNKFYKIKARVDVNHLFVDKLAIKDLKQVVLQAYKNAYPNAFKENEALLVYFR